MTKEKYKYIRKRDNFLFVYYLERGGILKNKADFKIYLNKWTVKNFAMSERIAGAIIIKYLDKKYKFES